jgi:hypothetical protein
MAGFHRIAHLARPVPVGSRDRAAPASGRGHAGRWHRTAEGTHKWEIWPPERDDQPADHPRRVGDRCAPRKDPTQRIRTALITSCAWICATEHDHPAAQRTTFGMTER